MGECRAKSSSFFISTIKYLIFNIFRYVHHSVTSLFKGGGLDFAQDRKFNFFLSPGGEV